MPELLREEPLTTQDKGSAGQDYVSFMAKLRGVSVSRPEPDNGTDLLMNLGNKYIRVQVKTRASQQTRGQSSVKTKQTNGECYKAIVDCVIVVDFLPLSRNCLPKLFVVPCCDLSNAQKSLSMSAIRGYEDRWDLLFCDQSVRDSQRIGIREELIASAIDEFSARGFSVSLIEGRLPGLLSVTSAGGKTSTVLLSKTSCNERQELHRIWIPSDFNADWMVAHDPALKASFFISRGEALSLAVSKRGRRTTTRSFNSSSRNAWHLLEGSGTDATRTNNN